MPVSVWLLLIYVDSGFLLGALTCAMVGVRELSCEDTNGAISCGVSLVLGYCDWLLTSAARAVNQRCSVCKMLNMGECLKLFAPVCSRCNWEGVLVVGGLSVGVVVCYRLEVLCGFGRCIGCLAQLKDLWRN